VLAADQSESRFDILDKVPVGILVLDPHYRILFWNECLENWTGVLSRELLGRDARERFPSIADPSFSKRIERVFQDGVPTVFSPQLHAPFIRCEITPGVFRLQYITVTSIPNPSAPGFLGVFSIQDISDLTRRLDASRGAERELANELKQRTELEKDLYAAKEAADEANRAKSDFLANMSHEIRTPMNGILGMIGLMLNSQLDSRQRRRAETLRSSAEALLAILNDILDLSKIEARKLELESADFDLRNVVEGVADLVAVTAQHKGLEVLCVLEQNVPTRLRGDPSRLRQVLVNLASNAVKFTHAGEVSIQVRLAAEPALIRFEIRDTGIGIPTDRAHLLFQPFSQADTTTTRRYGGTGLGLSIVARLAELMGGQVGFESQDGQGSCFWFTACLERQDAQPLPPLSLAGRRVLVVDDNAASRELLAGLLSFWQCQSESADDSETALIRLRSALPPFEAVIADLEIPGEGAEGLAAQMRGDPDLSGIPILLLTPLSQTAGSDHWRTLGFADRVTKPVKQGELGSCLASVLGCGGEPERPHEPQVWDESMRSSLKAGQRLLLVEDNLTNQEVALGMLENLGYHADVVADGLTALCALAQTDYDLVLMDCQLPDLDGYEASHLIRQPDTAVRNHNIPIIAMTAHAMAGDREKCLAAGMNDYLAKPIDPRALEQAIARWIVGSAAEIRTSVENPPAPPPSPAVAEFDLEDLLERLSGNEPLARRVITRFLSDVPEQLAALRGAFENTDGEAAQRSAHSIKGAAANAGGSRVREAARRLEQLIRDGDWTASSTMLMELSACFESVRPVLERFCRVEPDQ
jgi:signal transduction histidine kinase/CheY-like chemotaxis protein/HPt (histidine-containing phosphotransfer) domain-containing protein